jgi:hypothetical protein
MKYLGALVMRVEEVYLALFESSLEPSGLIISLGGDSKLGTQWRTCACHNTARMHEPGADTNDAEASTKSSG